MNAAGLRSAAKVLATNATGHALQQGLEELLAENERLRAALVAVQHASSLEEMGAIAREALLPPD